MSKTFTPPEDPVVLAAWAEVAPAPAVADFIAGRTYPENRRTYAGRLAFLSSPPVFPVRFVTAALGRNDRLITLALALHSDHATALGQLWRDASDDSVYSKALRRAVLANPHAAFDLTDEEWREFVLTAGAEDVACYCRKPVIDQEELEQILAGKGRFADLPEEQRLLWALLALRNHNLHRTHSDPIRLPVDGWEEYSDRKRSRAVLSAALKLLEWVPAEEGFALALAQGISRFSGRFEAPVDWLSKILDRWTVSGEEANENKPVGRDKNPYPNGFESLRMSLARQIAGSRTELREFVETHPDKWVRVGAIASKDFKSAVDVQSVVERERFLVLCNAFDNPAFHSRSKPEVVHAFRSFYGTPASQIAKAEGYTWESTWFAKSHYDHTADRLHGEDPEAFYSAAEWPEHDMDGHGDDPSPDELPEPLRHWVRDVRRAVRRFRNHPELGDVIVLFADKIARIQADDDFHRRNLDVHLRRLDHKVSVFYGLALGVGITAVADFAGRNVSDIWGQLTLWAFAIGIGVYFWRRFEKG